MNFDKIIEDRIIGMYESYDSVILEGFKDKINISGIKGKFTTFLKEKKKDKEFKEDVSKAKGFKERVAVVKKYESDFVKWCNQEDIKTSMVLGIVSGVILTNLGLGEIAGLLFVVCWGKDVLLKEIKARKNEK